MYPETEIGLADEDRSVKVGVEVPVPAGEPKAGDAEPEEDGAPEEETD